MTPSCQDYEVLLSAQLDGELTPEEADQLAAHLAVCPACRQLAQDYAALSSSLEDLPSPDLTSSILAGISSPQKAPPARKKRPFLLPLAAAAVAVLVLVFSLGRLTLPGNASSAADSQDTMSISQEAPQDTETAPAQNDSASPPVQDSDTPESAQEPLTQEQARRLLADELDCEEAELTPLGQSEDGAFWRFSHQGAEYSVSLETGEISQGNGQN